MSSVLAPNGYILTTKLFVMGYCQKRHIVVKYMRGDSVAE